MLTSFRVCIRKDLFLLSISHVISYNSTMTTHVDIFQSLYNEGPVPSVHLSCYILAYEKYLKVLAIYQVGLLWSKYMYFRHATISWGESVFLKRKSVSIRIIRQCIDVSRHFARHSHRDAVCKTNPDTG